MKHLQRAAGILAAFCLMIILFVTSVEAVVYWTPGYFQKEYEKYHVLEDLPAMTMEDLLYVTDEMMDYLKGSREDLHISVSMGGQEREFFNEREIAHMEDVQVLFLKAMQLRQGCLILCLILLTGMAISKAPLKRMLPACLCIGTSLFFLLIALLGLIISSDFTRYFILFHHLFFDNDLWILDPAEDMLINIVPEGFFMDTAARIALTFGGLSLLLFLICLFLVIREHGRQTSACQTDDVSPEVRSSSKDTTNAN